MQRPAQPRHRQFSMADRPRRPSSGWRGGFPRRTAPGPGWRANAQHRDRTRLYRDQLAVKHHRLPADLQGPPADDHPYGALRHGGHGQLDELLQERPDRYPHRDAAGQQGARTTGRDTSEVPRRNSALSSSSRRWSAAAWASRQSTDAVLMNATASTWPPVTWSPRRRQQVGVGRRRALEGGHLDDIGTDRAQRVAQLSDGLVVPLHHDPPSGHRLGQQVTEELLGAAGRGSTRCRQAGLADGVAARGCWPAGGWTRTGRSGRRPAPIAGPREARNGTRSPRATTSSLTGAASTRRVSARSRGIVHSGVRPYTLYGDAARTGRLQQRAQLMPAPLGDHGDAVPGEHGGPADRETVPPARPDPVGRHRVRWAAPTGGGSVAGRELVGSTTFPPSRVELANHSPHCT